MALITIVIHAYTMYNGYTYHSKIRHALSNFTFCVFYYMYLKIYKTIQILKLKCMEFLKLNNSL